MDGLFKNARSLWRPAPTGRSSATQLEDFYGEKFRMVLLSEEFTREGAAVAMLDLESAGSFRRIVGTG